MDLHPSHSIPSIYPLQSFSPQKGTTKYLQIQLWSLWCKCVINPSNTFSTFPTQDTDFFCIFLLFPNLFELLHDYFPLFLNPLIQSFRFFNFIGLCFSSVFFFHFFFSFSWIVWFFIVISRCSFSLSLLSLPKSFLQLILLKDMKYRLLLLFTFAFLAYSSLCGRNLCNSCVKAVDYVEDWNGSAVFWMRLDLLH